MFSLESDRPPDVVVAALKTLGGIGQLQEIVAQCGALGHPQPEPSVRRLVQQFSSDATWVKAKKPESAPDLFYSLEGVDKRSGFWGLRSFSVEHPDQYPIAGLMRAYASLLDRADTPLGNVRGIAYRDGVVHAIQVGFSADSPYPDTLLADGRIEHIGEGRDRVQVDSGGNHGMIRAHEQGLEIPVFQSTGRKGHKRYAALGLYRVAKHERRQLRFPGNSFDTDAFVFTLEPSSRGIWTIPPFADAGDPDRERGGNEKPARRAIADKPPKAAEGPPKETDPEARRQALERRNTAHHALVKAFEKRANQAGFECSCSQYADALCDGNIFEMKTLRDDQVAQVRSAVGQLYHYMFIHREMRGYENPRLFAVFDRAIAPSLADFLVDRARIGVVWFDGERFHGDQRTERTLAWLFHQRGS